ncbi:Protein of unknown function [Roseovarius nanhaiticus]|uniref:DUF2852 domain-containing protein n=1 Tax=Roseovarius nanhaiticus TaxID=573024 RepID=A0A1N7GCG3_9RHOB|nr:DUF2852 domain-containing protein [Roseovarius nanhaiticus]SEK30786.1 Protein of unknown function [Roseovarius nanhaiticus]SIS10273.1 Protein of unknown function [Roseovarius nanhaiticus]
MTTTAQHPTAAGSAMRWLDGITAWLDRRGTLAWVALLVVSFATIWPIGLALLGYLIWSKRPMRDHSTCRTAPFASRMTASRSSGNTAFDAYRDETLRRLQDEQASFEQFLERLRAAKDKAEFDQFMSERSENRRKDAEETGETGER